MRRAASEDATHSTSEHAINAAKGEMADTSRLCHQLGPSSFCIPECDKLRALFSTSISTQVQLAFRQRLRRWLQPSLPDGQPRHCACQLTRGLAAMRTAPEASAAEQPTTPLHAREAQAATAPCRQSYGIRNIAFLANPGPGKKTTCILCTLCSCCKAV